MRRAAFMLALFAAAPALAATVTCPIRHYKSNGQAVNMGEAHYSIKTVPEDNKSVAGSPPMASVVLANRIHAKSGSFKVYDPFGSEIVNAPAVIDRRTLAVALPPLKPGRYRVEWRAVCACDAHTDMEGLYHFTVQ